MSCTRYGFIVTKTILLKADEILSFLLIFVCFLNCRTYKDERGDYDVSKSQDIAVMLV